MTVSRRLEVSVVQSLIHRPNPCCLTKWRFSGRCIAPRAPKVFSTACSRKTADAGSILSANCSQVRQA